jgi:hypothetical protein
MDYLKVRNRKSQNLKVGFFSDLKKPVTLKKGKDPLALSFKHGGLKWLR